MALKTTILKAHKSTADACAADLLSRKTKGGKDMFTRKEIEGGFEIWGMKKNSDGKWEPVLILKWTKINGRTEMQYEDLLLSF